MMINMSSLLTSIDIPKQHSLAKLYDFVLGKLSFLSERRFEAFLRYVNRCLGVSGFWDFTKWADSSISGICRQCKLFISMLEILLIERTVSDF